MVVGGGDLIGRGHVVSRISGRVGAKRRPMTVSATSGNQPGMFDASFILVAMTARRNIALNLLRFVTILAGAAFAAVRRLVIPAADQKLEISHYTLEKLSALRGRPKYVDMPGTIYNGMRPESSRLLAEEQLNRLIEGLRKGLPSKPSKKFVLAEFAKTTSEFEASDTEDREQLVRYLQEIMDILGIASADGLLNRWMYGSVLGVLVDHDDMKRRGP
jgi:hypothetical protein